MLEPGVGLDQEEGGDGAVEEGEDNLEPLKILRGHPAELWQIEPGGLGLGGRGGEECLKQHNRENKIFLGSPKRETYSILCRRLFWTRGFGTPTANCSCILRVSV